MIKVENLYKSFDGVQVLKDINVSYEPGKCNMIIGASGSGKTVLLKNLIGLMTPDSGEISYGDRKLSSMTEEEKRELHQKIGILFQGSALFDFATVLENVMFPMEFFTDWSYAQRKERAQYCLERVNVIGSDNKYPNELSGGMQKRVGIARAIALNPEYLFCDEPNSGLDPYTSILIDRLISDLTKEFNMTTVVNTHDMNSILEIGDKIGFISGGSLLWQGDRHTILQTDCQELKDFVCANTLARNIIEGGK
ncbi:MAG: ATP-binding cassette domain-containing protein [Bacteroidales bacterium]|nr:ATP-binding cassette domain-containing protein [Bacteroidales bacterium]